jgi:2-polyprenyl-6-methoxyphenol hydroxylase-like FAD-dependent oxidoreductase
MHVIIIGAGTGGMCLAHGLRRAGISVAVYERDRTRRDGLYGYRVGIDPTGNRALSECLPPELFDTFIATCARAPKYFTVTSEKLRRTAMFPLRPDTDRIESERSVSRMTLRQVLLTGMEEVVHFDKEFVRYERNDDGTVTAFFADGTSATGDVLVAADGTGSRVRRQYLPHAEIKDAGVTAVAGKVVITRETKALLRPEMFEGISLTFAPHGQFCVWHVMEFKWDRDGTVKSGIGGNDAELIEQWPGLLYDNTRDYINWGFSAATAKFPANVMELRGEELQGVGANTALRDAALLCRELTAAHRGDKAPLEAIAAYEAEMIPYGFARVADSLAQNGTNGDDPLHKPVIGRIMLAFARTYFRVVSSVPPLKRKFLNDLYAYRGS